MPSTPQQTTLTETDRHPAPKGGAAEGLFIDEIVNRALSLCDELPRQTTYTASRQQIADLHSRLTQGKLHLAVLGQFNRGKSTFINALLGMKVLPTSVLPITSVPTVITWGERSSATVRFRDGSADSVKAHTVESIREVLLTYVAEENNPRNHRGVDQVIIECRSPILHHGTVLIDTPGFGSTHVHNTRTTLNVLPTCDAAIFLLSADLPITQVEVDFLREVRKSVTRLFFVFNKVDLLDGDDADRSVAFVQSVLSRDLGFAADTPLFRICARSGETCAGHHASPEWRQSGLEAVQTQIIDFLLREKYFALSEALDTKFREALQNVISQLDLDRIAMETPARELEQRAHLLHTESEALLRELPGLQAAIPVLKTRLDELITRQTTAQAAQISADLRERLAELLQGSRLKQADCALIASALGHLLREKIAHFHTDLCRRLHKPLHDLAMNLRQNSTHLLSRVRALAPDEHLPDHGIAQSDPEMPGADSPPAATATVITIPPLPALASRTRRAALCREEMVARIDALSTTLTDHVGQTVRDWLDDMLHQTTQEAAFFQDQLGLHLRTSTDSAGAAAINARKEAQGGLDMLQSLSARFAAVIDMLS